MRTKRALSVLMAAAVFMSIGSQAYASEKAKPKAPAYQTGKGSIAQKSGLMGKSKFDSKAKASITSNNKKLLEQMKQSMKSQEEAKNLKNVKTFDGLYAAEKENGRVYVEYLVKGKNLQGAFDVDLQEKRVKVSLNGTITDPMYVKNGQAVSAKVSGTYTVEGEKGTADGVFSGRVLLDLKNKAVVTDPVSLGQLMNLYDKIPAMQPADPQQ